tara:strand:+ start:779 stop:895 length:117 start_codon:yes stop_codon:yes gene_type:complete
VNNTHVKSVEENVDKKLTLLTCGEKKEKYSKKRKREKN